MNGEEEMTTLTSVDNILTERGNTYGAFVTQAEIAQDFKDLALRYIKHHDKTLKPDQREALDMIFSKIGRILNGNPDYSDSWTDIAGYAKLVADRLDGTPR